MTTLIFSKFETVPLKGNTDFTEKWVQKKIADDPSLLGLGDLTLLNEELIQPSGGKLDLLLCDTETDERYEVEIQLGRVDESHIIRTLEYWDIEKKRYPQYDHTAVIIAEHITGRFLNVISLFNGHIPLIAIQMKALKCGDKITLDFTKVLDRVQLGSIEPPPPPVDRIYWENKISAKVLKIADDLLEMINTFAPKFTLNYNKGYIGLADNGIACNFAVFYPKREFIRLSFKHPKSEDLEQQIEEKGYEFGHTKSGAYRIRVKEADIKNHSEFLTNILKQSFEKFTE